MHRAIAGNAACRGPIDAVFVHENSRKMQWVNVSDLRSGLQAAVELDVILSTATIAFLGSLTKEQLDHNASSVSGLITRNSTLRKIVFRDNGYKPIMWSLDK